MIKLIALDLDGTLLDSRGNISHTNRQTIRAAEAAGAIVTIATGRRFRDARPVGLDLGLNGPLITHNGALLKFAASLETVACSALTQSTVLEILRVGRELGGDALVSTEPAGAGTLLYDTVSPENVPLQRYLHWAKYLHGDNADDAVVHVPRLEDAVAKAEVIHISFSGGCKAMAEMRSGLETELGPTATILPTIYPKLDFTLIDILPPDASKGTGLEKLAAHYGLAAADVMAVGDNFNDIEMLEFAGTAVVMGNADICLRERREFYTTDSNDDNGVASAIERFMTV